MTWHIVEGPLPSVAVIPALLRDVQAFVLREGRALDPGAGVEAFRWEVSGAEGGEQFADAGAYTEDTFPGGVQNITLQYRHVHLRVRLVFSVDTGLNRYSVWVKGEAPRQRASAVAQGLRAVLAKAATRRDRLHAPAVHAGLALLGIAGIGLALLNLSSVPDAGPIDLRTPVALLAGLAAVPLLWAYEAAFPYTVFVAAGQRRREVLGALALGAALLCVAGSAAVYVDVVS